MHVLLSISQEWNFSINFLQLILTYLIKNSCSRMITMQFIPHTRHTSYIHSPFFFPRRRNYLQTRTRNKKICSLSMKHARGTKPGRKEERKELDYQANSETGKRKFGKFNCLDGPQTKRNDHRSITGPRVPKFVNTNNRARLSVTRCVTRFNSALTTEWGAWPMGKRWLRTRVNTNPLINPPSFVRAHVALLFHG